MNYPLKLKNFLLITLCISQSIFAQPPANADKKTTENLRTSVNFLASDKLEGRRTGTNGEKLAYEYIVSQFKAAGLATFTSDKTYLQSFDVNDGKEPGKETSLILDGKARKLHKDFCPYPFSANVKDLIISDPRLVAYYELAEVKRKNADNPHFLIIDDILNFTKSAADGGKKIVIVREGNEKEKSNASGVITNAAKMSERKPGADESAKEYIFSFDSTDKNNAAAIPVIYLADDLSVSHIAETGKGSALNLILTVDVVPKIRNGHNVVGYLNNNAPNTIILGAHYDHLGYGEDHNSLYTGTTPMIHKGADDNASGTAALIELGRWLKNSGYKNYNYLLLAFSGEELGLYGSKYFTEHAGTDLKTVNYMINMDMIGRLNDSTHGLTVGGYGTSPSWGKIINTKDRYFKINTDSSGNGPSDHTSFYRKDIPVLFFFTGSHKDYHKPTDIADKINYNGELQIIHYIQNIIAQTDKMPKLSFSKTREVSMGRSSFKVSLGIMPDYTFSGSGVMVDGVSENRPAQKAGIQTGDIIIQLGEHKFTDVQTYMNALNKFNKGESTIVTIMRGKEQLALPITF